MIFQEGYTVTLELDMPSPRKKQIVQAARKRQRRGRIYLVAIIIIVTTIGIGWYVYASSQPPTQSSGLPNIVYAKLGTSQGTIEVELYHSLTPKTVENFVNLSNQGFYNNLVWHRISKVDPFVIQTGDPNTRNGVGNSSGTWGSGSSSPTVPLEIVSSLHNYAGYLGMARGADPNSGSCQFYINMANNTDLDGSYTVFGRVISGMSSATAIYNTPTYASEQPVTLVYLTSVTISNNP
jgi:peptidylprolyl isomerase